MTADSRTEAALGLLHAAGLTQASFEVAGHDRAIAVISGVDIGSLPALATLAPEIKALGFRYLTLDITGPQP